MNKTILCISDHGVMLGGGEHSFLDLVKRLRERWNPIALVPEEGELSSRLRKAKIETYISPFSKIRPWTIHSVLKSLKNLTQLCQKIRPDLIYANGTRSLFYATISKLIHRIPVIWHCRTLDPDFFYDLLIGALTDAIIVNSCATKKRFSKLLKHRLRLVYNGIDIDWLTKSNMKRPDSVPKDCKIILIVARVSKWKCHDLALAAFNKVAELNQNIHLVLLGGKDPVDPQWWDTLQEKTNEATAKKRIHWMGAVSDVRPWYHIASILMLLSANEAFGRVLVEAMACGVPVIANDSGGIREIVRHQKDGFLVNSNDEKDICEKISNLVNDPVLRKNFASSARQRAHCFDIETHVARMEDVFKEIVEQS